MTPILRALAVLATIGTISFPTNAPKLAQSTNAGPRRAVAAPSTPAATPTQANFSLDQVEYYLNDDGIAYVRPGLKFKLNSITIGTNRVPVVDISFTDQFDQPLDRLGKTTPGVVSISFILGWYNPATRQYTAYTTRSVTTPANSPSPGVTTIQAGTDSGGTWTDLETGHARYTFKTALPSGFDQAKTHTLGVYGSRNLVDILGKSYYANLEYDFRPDGQKVTETWDKIRDASSCLNCHDPLGAHGGSRQDVKLCALCHQPQTIDPDTGEPQDLKVLVHKIHFGPNLPSVIAGKPYVIYGNSQSIHDYSHVTYPQDIRNCDNCHEGTNPATVPAQADVYYSKPSAAACGSCHDDVNFKTGANHPAGAFADDTACANCHIPDSGEEFDASVKGAHVIPLKSKQLKGLKAAIDSVTNLLPGKAPTVTVKLTNGDGSVVDGTKLTSFSPMIAGPTSSYSVYYREAAITKATFNAAAGTTSYTFTAVIPADAKGTWAVTTDAYRNVLIKRADAKADVSVRESAINPIKYVAIDGSVVVPRRTSVTMAQCNSCHDRLALHGGQRLVIEECVMCHNPMKDEISMQRMAHRIHTGEELQNEYKLGNTSFNEVLYPGDRRNCTKCHVNNSQNLPGQGDPVLASSDFFSPQGPGTAACLGCHDGRDAAAHAALNTTTFRDLPAEACATCHGPNSEWSVAKSHAR